MKRSRSFDPLLALAGLALAGVAVSRLRRDGTFFAGKVVAITGGSRGLGLVIARRLRAEGAHLALLARDPEELERARWDLLTIRAGEAPDAEVFSAPCDLTHPEEIQRAIGSVAQWFGALDVVINVAGIIQVGPLQNMTPADFERTMATNFWGAFHANWAALPHLRASKSARIVNVASIGGRIAVPHLAPYSASKFALGGPVERADRGTGAREHPRDDGVPGADAHGFARQRGDQGPARGGVRLVQHFQQLSAGFRQRRERRAADRGGVPRGEGVPVVPAVLAGGGDRAGRVPEPDAGRAGAGEPLGYCPGPGKARAPAKTAPAGKAARWKSRPRGRRPWRTEPRRRTTRGDPRESPSPLYHNRLPNSATEIPVWRRMARNVPRSICRWLGTTVCAKGSSRRRII